MKLFSILAGVVIPFSPVAGRLVYIDHDQQFNDADDSSLSDLSSTTSTTITHDDTTTTVPNNHVMIYVVFGILVVPGLITWMCYYYKTRDGASSTDGGGGNADVTNDDVGLAPATSTNSHDVRRQRQGMTTTLDASTTMMSPEQQLQAQRKERLDFYESFIRPFTMVSHIAGKPTVSVSCNQSVKINSNSIWAIFRHFSVDCD